MPVVFAIDQLASNSKLSKHLMNTVQGMLERGVFHAERTDEECSETSIIKENQLTD